MDIQALAVTLVLGGVAGWLAGLIFKGKGFGLAGNVVVGVVGAVIGNYTFALLGLAATGLVGAVITATVGAVILLAFINLVFRK